LKFYDAKHRLASSFISTNTSFIDESVCVSVKDVVVDPGADSLRACACIKVDFGLHLGDGLGVIFSSTFHRKREQSSFKIQR